MTDFVKKTDPLELRKVEALERIAAVIELAFGSGPVANSGGQTPPPPPPPQ